MNQISQRTIPALIALILAAGCDSLPDPKTITAAYPSIEATVYTPITVVTPHTGRHWLDGNLGGGKPAGRAEHRGRQRCHQRAHRPRYSTKRTTPSP